MSELITTLLVGISAFIGTNIDDIVILLLLFSQINSNFRCRHIIAGQYLGFTVLVLASLPGLFGGLIIPSNWIGLLGLIPIAMGISSLINQDDETPEATVITQEYPDTNTASIFNVQTYSVAVLTVANGSDNISVYIPLFASSNLNDFWIILGIFLILIAVWCYLAYKFTEQTKIADILNQNINYILPFVLILLGGVIVLKTQALNVFKLIASCTCLIVLVNKN